MAKLQFNQEQSVSFKKQGIPHFRAAGIITLLLLLVQQLAAVAGEQLTNEQPQEEPFQLSEVLAPPESLFRKDALEGVVEADGSGPTDCHLRNLDLCYAGLLSGGQRLLPESSDDLELLCDELRVAATCVAAFNQRCLGLEALETLAPMLGKVQRQLTDLQAASNVTQFSALCDPRAKGSPENQAARKQLFALARCVKARIPALRPCVDDLRTAVQLFYEPTRSLPAKPTCCAIARFRRCAERALDGVCGLSSFDQLESSLSEGVAGSSGSTMVNALRRTCRGAERIDDAYCLEVLPPSGAAPPQRRGRKASKLAKILELFSMSTGSAADAAAVAPTSSRR